MGGYGREKSDHRALHMGVADSSLYNLGNVSSQLQNGSKRRDSPNLELSYYQSVIIVENLFI